MQLNVNCLTWRANDTCDPIFCKPRGYERSEGHNGSLHDWLYARIDAVYRRSLWHMTTKLLEKEEDVAF